MATRQLLPFSVLVFGVSCLVLGAQSSPNTKPEDAPAPTFLAQHCKACHAGEKPRGNFRLDSLTQDFNNKANRERWLTVSARFIPPSKSASAASRAEVRCRSTP